MIDGAAALFDLDGTLLESGPSITASVRAALVDLGKPAPPGTDLHWVVGPPLNDSFARLLGSDDGDLIDEAMTRFRARYDGGGMFEAVLYPHVPDMLRRFRDAGWQLYLATSKPQEVARRLIRHFDLGALFAGVHGADDSGARSHKPELIAHVLRTENLAAARTVMIGDRSFDVAGAHANGVRAIGVLWGYGGEEELLGAGADALARVPDDLPALANRYAEPARHR
jgi:phosphoglycolate phosphatase